MATSLFSGVTATMSDRTKQVSARVTPMLRARAEETAVQLSGEREHLTRSDVVRLALEEFCTEPELVRDEILNENGIDPEGDDR